MTGAYVSWYVLLNEEARSSVLATVKQIGHSAKVIRDTIATRGDVSQNAETVFKDDVMEQWGSIGF